MFINQKIIKFLILIFCFSIFSSIAQTNEDVPLNNMTINEIPKPISPIIFEDFSGNKISLEDYNGKLVVINFWATWCPPCLAEIPALVRFQEAYRDKGVVVIGVNFMEPPDLKRLAQFTRDKGINYPMVYGNPVKIRNLAKTLGGVFGLPVTKVIDRKGQVVASHTGGLTERKMRSLVKPWLRKGDEP